MPEAKLGQDRPTLGSRQLVGAAGFVLSALLLWLALRGVDYHEVRGALSRAKVGWVLLAVVGVNAGLAAMAVRWRAACEPLGDRLPSLGAFLSTVLGAIAANNILPARPGEVLRIYWSGRATGGGVARGAAAGAADRASDIVFLALLLAAMLPFVHRAHWVSSVSVASLVVAALIAAGWAACSWYAGRARRTGAGLDDQGRGRFRAMAIRFTQALAAIPTPGRLTRMLGATAFVWATWGVGAWAVGRALGIDLGAAEVLLLGAVVNLGTAIPSSPGFVGTYQWLVVETLGLADVGRSEAFAYSVLLHATWFVPTTIAGLAMLPRLGVSLRSLVRSAETSTTEATA